MSKTNSKRKYQYYASPTWTNPALVVAPVEAPVEPFLELAVAAAGQRQRDNRHVQDRGGAAKDHDLLHHEDA